MICFGSRLGQKTNFRKNYKVLNFCILQLHLGKKSLCTSILNETVYTFKIKTDQVMIF